MKRILAALGLAATLVLTGGIPAWGSSSSSQVVCVKAHGDPAVICDQLALRVCEQGICTLTPIAAPAPPKQRKPRHHHHWKQAWR